MPSLPLGNRFNPVSRRIRLSKSKFHVDIPLPLLHDARSSFNTLEHLVHLEARSSSNVKNDLGKFIGAVRPSQMSPTSMFPPILRHLHSGNCILNASSILTFLCLILSLSLSLIHTHTHTHPLAPFRLPGIR